MIGAPDKEIILFFYPGREFEAHQHRLRSKADTGPVLVLSDGIKESPMRAKNFRVQGFRTMAEEERVRFASRLTDCQPSPGSVVRTGNQPFLPGEIREFKVLPTRPVSGVINAPLGVEEMHASDVDPVLAPSRQGFRAGEPNGFQGELVCATLKDVTEPRHERIAASEKDHRVRIAGQWKRDDGILVGVKDGIGCGCGGEEGNGD